VLRLLAEHCDFGDRLTDDLRDRRLCGKRHENIQSKLLSETGLTLKQVIGGCQLFPPFKLNNDATVKESSTLLALK
jgi:hypothetical protein